MDNKDFENQNEIFSEPPKKGWKIFGTICLSIFLAVLTIVVINL